MHSLEKKVARPFIEIADGHQLFVRDWGAGTPVVLLSGWAMDSRGWAETMIRITHAGFRAISMDRRGHGRSTDPGVISYDLLADDLATVIDRLGLDKIILVAHSGAGGEAIRYLSRYGSTRVARLVLVGATGPKMVAQSPGDPGIPKDLVELSVNQIAHDLESWLQENLAPFAPGADQATLDWLGTMARDSSRRLLVDFQRAILETDFVVEARKIDVPVRLIHGTEDVSAPIDLTARHYAKIIPNAELLVYEDAAHGLMITHAGRLAEDIIR
ncbi:MAG: alpha/beta fold hydrolase [Bdellovibrionia bacterium]